MQLLDSIIAFALIMAALASVVTIIMEIFHRVFRLRAKGMEHLFAQFYQDVIAKKLVIPAQQAEQIFNAVLYSPVRAKLIAESRFLPKSVVGFLTAHTEVNADDLLTRLNQAGAFDVIKKKTRSEFKTTLESIEAQYNAYSAAASDYFKRRAQLFSLLVGIVLAFAVNIDGMRILDSLMVSPQVRASIISQQANLEKSFQNIQAEVAKSQGPNGTAAQPGTSLQPSGAAPSENTALTDVAQADMQQIEKLHQDVATTTQTMRQLGTLGVPLGWQYPAGPFKAYDSSGFEKTFANLFDSIEKDPGGFLVWIFKVFITGLLIGLGAPFWFDVARRLAQVRQAFSGKGASNPPAAGPVASGQAKPVKTTIDKIVNG